MTIRWAVIDDLGYVVRVYRQREDAECHVRSVYTRAASDGRRIASDLVVKSVGNTTVAGDLRADLICRVRS
jgi:hypothetical protein